MLFKGMWGVCFVEGKIELDKLGYLGVKKFELDRWIDVGSNILKM